MSNPNKPLLRLLSERGGLLTTSTERLRRRLNTDDIGGLLHNASEQDLIRYRATNGIISIVLMELPEHL